MHQDPYLKTEKRRREPILIPIIEIGDAKRKHIIGPVPMFKTESESETDTLPTHSNYIKDVLTLKYLTTTRLMFNRTILKVPLK